VDNALYDAFGQRIASTYYTQSNQYRVILKANMHDLGDLSDAIAGFYLPSATATAGQVPLAAIVQLSQKNAPLQIENLGQLPSISISFNLAKGASFESAVAEIKQAETDIGLPASFATAYQGALSAFQK
jgi:multidrug efflux pump